MPFWLQDTGHELRVYKDFFIRQPLQEKNLFGDEKKILRCEMKLSGPYPAWILRICTRV